MTPDEKTSITAGHVVQINPATHQGAFKGCFVVVTEGKPWGVHGYVSVPREQGQGTVKVNVQLQFKEIEMIGIKRFA